MANEISVSAILIEMEDGSYKSSCPDLGIDAEGGNADEAFNNLKDAVTRHIREKGADNIQLNPVKCMKFKVQI
ncbi:MAG: hypothetical protein HY889_04845 [Deltaproteobacteria bacterium]|nr:hypothetical protein [Deltaproteobacteria bacterium]